MRLLLCTDGSPIGLRAVKLGAALASRMSAEATLLLALDGEDWDTELAREHSLRVLQESAVQFSFAERRAKLVDATLAELVDREYDLVVVGYNARTFLERALWGSLAARIAHEFPLPVMIVRGEHASIDRLLIGISGGGFTDACVEWGGRIASAFEARVVLLHVGPSPPLMYGGFEEVVQDLAELLRTDTVEARAIKRAASILTRLGVEFEVELVRGLAEREILRYAQELTCDLIVIGSAWAAQPMRRFFMRNVTEQVVLKAQRPVLVVRPIAENLSEDSFARSDSSVSTPEEGR
jgi:nucleotide-binding universal stress UspA family protein